MYESPAERVVEIRHDRCGHGQRSNPHDRIEHIMDRDPLYMRAFRAMLASSAVRTVRLAARSPNLNAYAERWIGSVRRDHTFALPPGTLWMLGAGALGQLFCSAAVLDEITYERATAIPS
jgi:hypothetical protein